mmetsp:Transcript_97893/g.292428  ORF Transcript_97893/g.292428 Transcript_97893/m.292428 type:complete len:285 (-) Transcript_97893:1068-1922(-)
MVGVHDDVHARYLSAAELLSLDAGNVYLLPGLWVVCLARGLNRLRVLPELHVAGGQLGVIGDGLVEDLGGLVRSLLIEPVAHRLDVGRGRAAHKLLHLGQAVGLGVGVDELAVDELVLLLVPGHLQVAHKLLVVLLTLGRLDDLGVVRGVLGLEVGLDGLRHEAVPPLRLPELVPHGGFVAAGGELLRPLHGLHVCQQRVHGLGVHVALLVDEEGLLVQAVGLAEGNAGNLRPVIVLQAVDVVHDAGLVDLQRRQEEQVLQVLVLAEVGVVQHDLLQQLHELRL